jgi:nucleoside-diphosphate-sugar epimerase
MLGYQAIVFGGTGFIGSHVVEQLRHTLQHVTAPVRAGSDTGFLDSIGASPVVLDFSRQDDIVNVIKGHALVYCCLANPCHHLALVDLREVEVGLTGRVIAAAAQAGARRVVLLSTVMVYGFCRPPQLIDEDYPPDPTYAFNRVALEREIAAREVAAQAGIELVILRPANTLGRRDKQMSRLFAACRKGNFPVFGHEEFRFSAVDARDVGRAMAFLGELASAAGQTYLLKGYDTSWLELKAAIEKLSRKNLRVVRLPLTLSRLAGLILETLWPYGKEPPLSRFSVAVMSTHTLFDCRKILSAGFVPQYSLEDSLDDIGKHDYNGRSPT